MKTNRIWPFYNEDGRVAFYARDDGSQATEEEWQKQVFGQTETEYYDKMVEDRMATCDCSGVDDWGVPYSTKWNANFE